MPEFTIGERILLHLYNFRMVSLEDYYNIPWDVTQDGISTSLRISRAHASLELKKQKERGNIRDALVRIYGGKVRRLAYVLTQEGTRVTIELQEKAKKAGIDVRTLTDMKKQDTAVMLDGMKKDDRLALGTACAFRVAVPLEALPPHDRSVIPTDVTGFTSISSELRDKMMRAQPCRRLLRPFRTVQYHRRRGLQEGREDLPSPQGGKIHRCLQTDPLQLLLSPAVG